MDKLKLKCVVMGSHYSGKTSLINTFMNGCFYDHIPNDVVTRYDVNFVCKPDFLTGQPAPEVRRAIDHYFKIYDYEPEKSNSSQFLHENELDQVDVIILCYQSASKESKDFLINNYKSFLKSKWPNTPIVLASCFSDLLKPVYESTQDLSQIDFNLNSNLQADQDLMNEFGARKHFFCSSLEYFNIHKIFTESFKQAILNRSTRTQNSSNLKPMKLEKPSEVTTPTTTKVNPVRCAKQSKSHSTSDLNKIREKNIKYVKKSIYETSTQKSFTKSTSEKNVFDFDQDIYSRPEKQPKPKENCNYGTLNLKENIQVFIAKKETSSKVCNALGRLVLSLFVFGIVLFFAFTYRYCHKNQNHCDEIYELSKDTLDDSVSTLNESFIHLKHQMSKFKSNN